ncbi:ty3-gypsy retrotransposon protein [Tanacetum coccineum]
MLSILQSNFFFAKQSKCEFGSSSISYLAHYALLAAPLTQLLRKDAFVWSDSATTTFNKLKHALTQTPVLTLSDFSKAFIIQTDASGYWIGAILSQGGHPIAYFSKQMSLRLQQASTYAREMFAITEAVKC